MTQEGVKRPCGGKESHHPAAPATSAGNMGSAIGSLQSLNGCWEHEGLRDGCVTPKSHTAPSHHKGGMGTDGALNVPYAALPTLQLHVQP